jgi:undecaprenyl diphosphate synthase
VSAPKYVAIITDGNGGDPGAVRARVRDAAELGIEQLTVCSSFGELIASETSGLGEDGVRIRFIGHRADLSAEAVEQMEWAEAKTAANDRISLFVAFNYGGRAEIVDAARTFQGDSEEEFRAHLYAPEMHDPDLLIRTSGEQRVSNYLLWQCAYSELVFSEALWPDFDRGAFEGALNEYETRQRRFGART